MLHCFCDSSYLNNSKNPFVYSGKLPAIEKKKLVKIIFRLKHSKFMIKSWNLSFFDKLSTPLTCNADFKTQLSFDDWRSIQYKIQTPFSSEGNNPNPSKTIDSRWDTYAKLPVNQMPAAAAAARRWRKSLAAGAENHMVRAETHSFRGRKTRENMDFEHIFPCLPE